MGERGLFHIFFVIKGVVLVGALIVLWKDKVSTNYVADCRIILQRKLYMNMNMTLLILSTKGFSD